MKIRTTNRVALGICAASALAACGTAQPPINASEAMSQTHVIAPLSIVRQRRAPALSYQELYSFAGGPDGADPNAALIDVDGALYGTTSAGGADGGGGTVFSITTSGAEKVLYSFSRSGRPDGNSPRGVIDVGGTLYGTAEGGGSRLRRGTVFSITPSSVVNVLYTFNGYPDGKHPNGIIDVGGTFYGTTAEGGTYGGGTVFSLGTTGTEHVLHSFQRRSFLRDGRIPNPGLIDVNGTLYGTTSEGGTYGRGTVFTITTGGVEKLLYSFTGKSDGEYPNAGLVDAAGTLYGTTKFGGAYYGGTAFSITPSGSLKVLHSFGGSDGASPVASLIGVKGTLYGTTQYGGKYSCGQTEFSNHCGTVFSIKPNGTEQVLHSFGGPGDGVFPVASLINVGGTLYGTTKFGGTYRSGIVFAITP
jgi:uncharacterized repeat protein (TIGR03803 family)